MDAIPAKKRGRNNATFGLPEKQSELSLGLWIRSAAGIEFANKDILSQGEEGGEGREKAAAVCQLYPRMEFPQIV